ncbi:pentatricopeptide repeat-containing protein At1g50270 [Argentina anserina]|uniref:pentatricopeptide repeat-containing protein At1g50270 n=1 Tax=Argentina anserina TaxID=57926 RepID=UPI00217695C2|nr:pentatricopeptide repeat-containing protein At1g50270 [Potentilla anserina]
MVGNTILSLCHKDTTFNHLRQIHSLLITLGPSENACLFPKLLNCIAPTSKPSHLSYASFLIDHVQAPPTTQLWNSFISAFSKTSEPHRSLVSYSTMRRNGVVPNQHTFPLLLKAFPKLKHTDPFQYYGQTIKFGWNMEQFVVNTFISVLFGCGYLEAAHQVFVESTVKDVVAWTVLADGFLKYGRGLEAMRCFVEMRLEGIRFDERTVVSALCAAGMVGDERFGRWVHEFYVETGRVKWDDYVGSALVDMYMKCGCHDDTQKVFDAMPSRNVVSWSALLAGYVQCEKFRDALLVLKCMVLENVKPNQSTLSSALTCCAHLGALDQGKLIHGYMYRHQVQVNTFLGTVLVDMYAKCGCIDKALSVFSKLLSKDVFIWTAMINGLASHGDALGALNFFSLMLESGVQPNEVTFMAVLSACAHRGLVEEGRKTFKSMKQVFHLEPYIDHYGCMVDLLGRVGYLEEARQMIEEMPMVPTAYIWGAFLNSCVIHKNFELGELAGSHLIKLDSNHGGGHYVLLANLYSKWKKWKVAAGIRKLMKGKGVEKIPGCSWIEVNGAMFEFAAFDKSHSESDRIYLMLENMLLQLRLSGYVPDTNLLAS